MKKEGIKKVVGASSSLMREQDAPATITPKLRFPKFRNAKGWESKRLGILFSDRQESGLCNLPLLSLMNKEGIVPQENSNRKNNSNSDKSKYLRVVPGDIAYNTMRMWEGRSAYVGLEGLVSPAYTVCQPKDEVHSLFFSYYFKTPQLIEQFRQYSQGLVKDTLNLKYEAFSKIAVLTPAFQEQQKIADCLTSLDELINTESQKLVALKTHKNGLMQQLFPQEGETVPRLRFPEFRNAGEWEPKTLIDACKMQAGKFVAASEIKEHRTNGLFPCFGGNGLRGFTETYTHNGTYPLIGRQGALCGNINLSTGRFHATEHAVVAKPNTGVLVGWLYYELVLLNLNRFATGQAQPGLSVDVLEEVPVAIPKNENEQQRIADCLSSLDDLITTQAQKLETLMTHKIGLMQQLFPSAEVVA
jgi:type I restriction enzyme S subunit